MVTLKSILSATIQCINRASCTWIHFPRDWLFNFAFLSLLLASRIPLTFKSCQQNLSNNPRIHKRQQMKQIPSKWSKTSEVSQIFFGAAFTLELLLKFVAGGCLFFKAGGVNEVMM